MLPKLFFPVGKPLRSAHCCAVTRPVEGLTSVSVCVCVCVCAPHPLLQCCRGDAEQACASLLKRGRCAKVSAQDRADECCTHRGQTTNLTADSLKRGKKCLEWKGYYVVKRKKKEKKKTYATVQSVLLCLQQVLYFLLLCAFMF